MRRYGLTEPPFVGGIITLPSSAMTTPTPDPSAHLSQIVRYSLQLPTMIEPTSLALVRTLLMDHHLVVDRIVPGEALVASATSSDPDWQTIKTALHEAGYPLQHTTTVDD